MRKKIVLDKEIVEKSIDERFEEVKGMLESLAEKTANYIAENYELEFEFQGRKIRIRFVKK